MEIKHSKEIWIKGKHVANILEDRVVELDFFNYYIRHLVRAKALKLDLMFVEYTGHLKPQSSYIKKRQQPDLPSKGIYEWELNNTNNAI